MDGIELLAHLHRGGTFGYFWHMLGKRTDWYKVGSSVQLPGGANVYWGVHPTRVIPATNSSGQAVESSAVRAQLPVVAAINCFFVEFDAKDFGGSKDLTRTFIADQVFVQPSILIDSGGGFHAYYTFEQPFMLDTDAKRATVDRLQKAFVIATGGDKGAKDLCRVLRVPGTLNTKYATPRPVRIVDDNGYLFDYQELADLIEFHAPPIEGKAQLRPAPAGMPQSVDALSRFMEGQKAGNRNNALFWAACKAFEDGLSRGQVEQALLVPAMRVGLSDKEALRTIQSAQGRISGVTHA